MSVTRVKICGVRDAQTARRAAEAGADAVGVVFVKGSQRCVTIDEAKAVVEALPAFVMPVGLFVNADSTWVRQAAEVLGLCTVQLHGDETVDDVAKLAPLRVIKAINFDAANFDAKLGAWRDGPANLAGLLIDAPVQGAALPGGSGRTFDWAMVASMDRARLPAVILAGGLTADNVGRAIEVVKPYAVDVSSGVEVRPSVKDHSLIAAFCRAVKGGGSL